MLTVIVNTIMDKHVDNQITTGIYDNTKQHKREIYGIIRGDGKG